MALIYTVVLRVLAPSSLVTTGVSDVDETYTQPSRADYKVKPVVRNAKKCDKQASAEA
jgi:hypothetical protein